MYVLLRFVEDIDNRLHEIPVEDILDFDPRDENDFDNRATHTAQWEDPTSEENSREYVVQILLLAATAEDMAMKRRTKRAPIPRINASDLEDENDDEAAAARKNARQQSELEQQHTSSLRERIRFLEGKVESQLSSGDSAPLMDNDQFILDFSLAPDGLVSTYLQHS
ncbi:hypothetical protein HPB48_010472 [Haemaphysalis longicornis]|uniref:Uncharacterized protein n=1 Tax=Haemaphysalis longicornis TaxID=44386 RepID=A0A9J6FEK0_HAELO|nr:hypothetical protein HPB48_010472 [Haemaphysalis longicornis]